MRIALAVIAAGHAPEPDTDTVLVETWVRESGCPPEQPSRYIWYRLRGALVRGPT